MKILYKLTGIIVSLVLLTILVNGILGWQMGSVIIATGIQKIRLQSAVNLMTSIDYVMQFYNEDLTHLATDYILRNEKSTPQEVEKQLLSDIKQHADFLSMAFLRANRQIVAQAGEKRLIGDAVIGRFWDNVLFGKVSVGEYLVFDGQLKTPILYITAPVQSDSGKFVGAVIIASDLRKINSQVDNFTKVQGEYVTLINKEKDIISSSDPEYKDKALQTKIEDFQVVKNVLSGKEGVTEEFFPLHKETEIIAAVKEKGVEDFTGNDWALLIMADKDKVFAPLNSYRNNLLILGGVFFIISAFLGLFLAQIITRPLKKMVMVVKSMAEGDLTQRVDIKSKDEFGVLASNFNAMANQIDNSEKDLKQSSEQLQTTNVNLKEKLDELEKFQRLTIGRELVMADLKDEIKELKKEKNKNEK